MRRQRDRERSRRRTAERRARGLCPRCGMRKPEPDHSVCGTCAEKRRTTDRARAAKRRAAGIRRVRDPNARQAEYARARQRTAERLAQGLCATCGRHPPEPDRCLCAHCGERRRESERARYRAGKTAGHSYGGRNADSKRRQARRRGRTLQRARRQASLCIRCGACPPVQRGSSCEPCLRKRRAAGPAALHPLRSPADVRGFAVRAVCPPFV